jgi:hypothetical protein
VKVATTLPCIVCRRAEGSRQALSSGPVVDICEDCLRSPRRVAEAERRAVERAKERDSGSL